MKNGLEQVKVLEKDTINNELSQLKKIAEKKLQTKNSYKELSELQTDIEPQTVTIFWTIDLTKVKINSQSISKIQFKEEKYYFYDMSNKIIESLSGKPKTDLHSLNIVWTDWYTAYKIKTNTDEKLSIVNKNSITLTKNIDSETPQDPSWKIILATIDGFDSTKTYNINSLKLFDVAGKEIQHPGEVKIDQATWVISYTSAENHPKNTFKIKFNIVPIGLGIPLYDQEFIV